MPKAIPPITLDPHRLYSTSQMKKFGFGEATLMEMRASGIVKPFIAGICDFYSGREVIAWIESLPTRKPGKRRNGGNGNGNGNNTNHQPTNTSKQTI